MPGPINPVKAHALGKYLRKAREAAKVTQQQAAERLNEKAHSIISRFEAAKQVPSVEAVATLLGFYGVQGALRDEILKTAREATIPNRIAPGVDPLLAQLMENEGTAEHIIAGEHSLLPGPVQTPTYAQQIMTRSGVSFGHSQQRVATRLGRRHIFTRRKNPVKYEAFIREDALRNSVDDRAIMAEQLFELVELGKLPNVNFWVVPYKAGYTFLQLGAFELIYFANELPPVLYKEHYRGSEISLDTADIADYEYGIRGLRGEHAGDPEMEDLNGDKGRSWRGRALPPDASLTFIQKLAEEME